MKLRDFLLPSLCLVSLQAWPQTPAPGALSIRAGEGGEFPFDTGVVSGVFRAGGKPRGLSSAVHLPSGLSLTQAKLSYGLLSFYRVFAGGRRFGTAAWDWPGEGKLHPDGSLETLWTPAADRPFALRSVYRWRSPDTLDLSATVEARDELPDFEVFVASYFAAQFTPTFVHTGGFQPAGDEDGDWQMFPRDAAARRVIQDGRWKLPPNPVDWIIRPKIASPVAYRRDPGSGTTVILMADPRECFAIATPKAADIHYSTYFSLFGRTLKAGQTATARMRLLILRSPPASRILEEYRRFQSENVARP